MSRLLRCAQLYGVEIFLFRIIVASFGVPMYLTSIFSIRPMLSRCFFCSKSKILLRFRTISSLDKLPETQRPTLNKAHFRFFTSKLTFLDVHQVLNMLRRKLTTHVSEKICCHCENFTLDRGSYNLFTLYLRKFCFAVFVSRSAKVFFLRFQKNP